MRGGDDGTFLQLKGELFFLSAHVRSCILSSPESVMILWQRKPARRAFINFLTGDVIPSYTFFLTKLSIYYYYEVIWLYDRLSKIDKVISSKLSNVIPSPLHESHLKSQIH